VFFILFKSYIFLMNFLELIFFLESLTILSDFREDEYPSVHLKYYFLKD
jgi:hypothetical protein